MLEDIDPAQKFIDEIESRNVRLNQLTERGDSQIQQFYSGAVVFLTGGSGFLGKQLVEKLFRATKISKVFLLMRPKKGKAIEERLQAILEDPVYDILRQQQPNFADKIIPVAGDVAELRLGINEEDWSTIAKEVHVIFHLAATTHFDAPLPEATMINVRGTREVLKLGKASRNLISFVHVSTAYSQACEDRINGEVKEDFYQSPVDPDTLITLAESTDEERFNVMTPSFMKDWPNTYTFTKAVAEDMIRTIGEEIPICIVRPAIVICSQREPTPGWLDMSCIYNASGIIFGTGLGVMHTVLTDDDVALGLIPVDQVNNAILAAGWETAKNKSNGKTKPKIYTLITSTRNPGVWRNIRNTLENEAVAKYSTPAAVWCFFTLRTNKPFLFWIYSWLLHLIPAHIIDGACSLVGKKRRFVKIFSKTLKLMLAVSFFNLNTWHFEDKNTEKLYDSLSEVDQEIFDFDVNKINWQEYIVLWCLGVRKYIIKDGLKNTKYGLKKQYFFKILSCFVLPLYFFLLFKTIYYIFGSIISLAY